MAGGNFLFCGRRRRARLKLPTGKNFTNLRPKPGHARIEDGSAPRQGAGGYLADGRVKGSKERGKAGRRSC